ncbi:MAG: ACT domain-containing protein [Candidatus Methanomethylicia archaeon]|nr:ACT domain-containing protein [Candidatus Methanomethylicia archaeon]
MNKEKDKPSIAEITKNVILQHPSILDCVKINIVNYSALASKIKSEVEKIAQRKNIREEAVKIALIRFSQEISSKGELLEEKVSWLLANSTIELKSDIAVITVKQSVLIDKLNEVMKIATKSRFFQLTQGIRTFTLIFDKKIMDELIKEIREVNIDKFINDQSAIIIVSPIEVIEIPGFISYVTTQLAWNGINITQIVSCHEDTILIIDRKDSQKAYSIIENMIINHRNRINITHRSSK